MTPVLVAVRETRAPNSSDPVVNIAPSAYATTALTYPARILITSVRFCEMLSCPNASLPHTYTRPLLSSARENCRPALMSTIFFSLLTLLHCPTICFLLELSCQQTTVPSRFSASEWSNPALMAVILRNSAACRGCATVVLPQVTTVPLLRNAIECWCPALIAVMFLRPRGIAVCPQLLRPHDTNVPSSLSAMTCPNEAENVLILLWAAVGIVSCPKSLLPHPASVLLPRSTIDQFDPTSTSRMVWPNM